MIHVLIPILKCYKFEHNVSTEVPYHATGNLGLAFITSTHVLKYTDKFKRWC